MTESKPQLSEQELKPTMPRQGIIFDRSRISPSMFDAIKGHSESIAYHNRHGLPLGLHPSEERNEVES